VGAQAYLQHWEKEHPEELKKERTPPLQVQEHLLIRSDRKDCQTGYKGVQPNKSRYQAACDTLPCHNNHLGRFDTPEEAAQAYLQHWEKEHPKELKKVQAPPLQVQEHLLIRSDRNSTGYKGVHPDKSRYQAKCGTLDCRHNYLGLFDTPEEAAQAYLQHYQKKHPEELKKCCAPPLQVQEHLLIRSDQSSTGYKGVYLQEGRNRQQRWSTTLANWLTTTRLSSGASRSLSKRTTPSFSR
jgi:hypothetical protein